LADEGVRAVGQLLGSDPTAQELRNAAHQAHVNDLANIVRVYGANRRALGEADVVPVLPTVGSVSSNVASRKTVLSVVLSAMPLPDESTPWEAILDFRGDPEVRRSLQRLRRWMTKAEIQQKDPRVVELELADLLEAYSSHMRLHRIKTTKGRLEAVVTLAAEVVDALLRVGLGSASKALFSLANREIATLEAELTAPGREIAYIAKAEELFK